MKLYKLFQAYHPIDKACRMDFPYKKSREILLLRNRVRTEYEFYSQEEMKLVEQYAKKDADGRAEVKGGKVSFETLEHMKEYSDRLAELRDTEIDIAFLVIHITDQEIGDQRISGQDIDLLKDFIKFGDD